MKKIAFAGLAGGLVKGHVAHPLRDLALGAGDLDGDRALEHL